MLKLTSNDEFPITDDYQQLIDDEKKKLIELEAKNREWERKIKAQHRNMGGVHMSAQHTVQTQKTLRTLENRLDQVNISQPLYNTIVGIQRKNYVNWNHVVSKQKCIDYREKWP